MSGLLQHLKVSAIADGADPSQVQPSDWNAAHKFSGGNHGAIPIRDTGDVTYGSNWLASVAAGESGASTRFSLIACARPTAVALPEMNGPLARRANIHHERPVGCAHALRRQFRRNPFR